MRHVTSDTKDAVPSSSEPHSLTRDAVEGLSPSELREVIRDGRWSDTTEGLALGFLQANVVILPEEESLDFLRFCLRNPKPCPILEITDTGSPVLQHVAPGADLRTDLPQYRLFRDGELVEEPSQIKDLWEKASVGFVLGCSVTFEAALIQSGIPMRHIEHGKKVPSYYSSIPCQQAGRFSGNLVVNMRPIPGRLVAKAVEVTSRYPHSHGSPVHIGDPSLIGIDDLQAVAWGSPPIMHEGDVPVFWAGGTTPQRAIHAARPRYAITHKPGHMLVCDLTSELNSPTQ